MSSYLHVFSPGGVDYGPFPSSQIRLLTIVPANSTGTVFGVNIRDDDIVESDETFLVSLMILDKGFNPFFDNPSELPTQNSVELLLETVVVIEDDDCK